MEHEEKDLLLKDLSGRLPYGVKLNTPDGMDTLGNIDTKEGWINAWINASYDVDEVKPYLRPMSSMTDDEIKELNLFGWVLYIEGKESWISSEDKNEPLDTGGYRANLVHNRDLVQILDWLNAHHFDYRGLIEKELAIEAPKDMYI